MEIDFSSEEEDDVEEHGGITMKNMGKKTLNKLLNNKYKPKKEGTFMPTINMTNYYTGVEKKGKPDSPTYKKLRGDQLAKKAQRDKDAL